MDAVTGILGAIVGFVTSWWWVVPALLVAMFLVPGALQRWALRMLGIILIPENKIGVVNIKFILFRKYKTVPDGQIIALRGEAGYQAETLAPGVHFGFWPWQFQVKETALVVIDPGEIGIVEAIDGTPIPAGRVLAKQIDCSSFQDAKAFLLGGGERGPQITVMPSGTYRINDQLFKVTREPVVTIRQGEVGIVTTNEGTPLATGEIAGRKVDGHEMFQNAQVFVNAGGNKGLQEQVILAGTYFINPKFATIERVPMTEIQIGEVGVVVAYVGEKAPATQTAAFKHGTIVETGFKGVEHTPLDPGMYPINPKTHKVERVPTTNIVLNWATGKTASHALDEHLSTIIVRSADGFTFTLDVSQIIHVSRDKASAVIARFGTMKNLVSQVLEPLIGNYFRNSAQASDVIDFLQNRATRQLEAKTHIETALSMYDVQAVDSLIGDINPPKELMDTLTELKVAERLKATYEKQKEAQVVRDGLEQATAQANTRGQVVQAERNVEIAELDAKATVNQATGEATKRRTLADADAHVLTVTGEAQAANTSAVGGAEAEVLQKKVLAVGADSYAAMAMIDNLSKNDMKLVPEILINGGGSNGGGASEALLALLASRLVQKDAPTVPPPAPAPLAPPTPEPVSEAA